MGLLSSYLILKAKLENSGRKYGNKNCFSSEIEQFRFINTESNLTTAKVNKLNLIIAIIHLLPVENIFYRNIISLRVGIN